MTEIAQSESPSNYAVSFAKAIRYAAWIAALMIIVWLAGKFGQLGDHKFPWLLWINFIFAPVYGTWMLLPWSQAKSGQTWKFGMIGFMILSFLFVFLLIANVMVDASTAGDRGEKLGVPGFEGAMIFLSLAQIPGILFARHPEMME